MTKSKKSPVWTPRWYWPLVGLAVIVVHHALIGSMGLDPVRNLSAAVGGAIGGAIGGLAGAIIGVGFAQLKALAAQKQLIVGGLAVLGFIIGQIFESGIQAGISSLFPDTAPAMFVYGGLFGSFAGLIPLQTLKKRREIFGIYSFWFCTVIGFFGGLLLALPSAAIATFIGLRKKAK